MSHVETNEEGGGGEGEEDEIDKSIQVIHQSAQKLSVNVTNCNSTFPSVSQNPPQGEI